MIKRAILIGVVLLAGCGGNDNGAVTVTGQIEAVSVAAGSRIGGRVKEVLVAEGARVKLGDVMVRLESDEADAMLAAASARSPEPPQARPTRSARAAGARATAPRRDREAGGHRDP